MKKRNNNGNNKCCFYTLVGIVQSVCALNVVPTLTDIIIIHIQWTSDVFNTRYIQYSDIFKPFHGPGQSCSVFLLQNFGFIQVSCIQSLDIFKLILCPQQASPLLNYFQLFQICSNLCIFSSYVFVPSQSQHRLYSRFFLLWYVYVYTLM